ncbi:MAG: 50S ribosomal protein L20 [Bacteroidia bacterium]|nr:50S ribosomal protein L20 [Bacteroidia bacterium]
MPRATNAPARKDRRKKILKAAKGYFGRRKNVYTVAKNAVEKGMQYSYIHRKTKKREYRRLWIARINAAVREHGLSYSKFMNLIHTNNVDLNRKTLAEIAMNDPETFKAIVDKVNK